MINRIGINLLYINPKLAGGSVTYALNVLEQLAEIDKETEYIIYINRDCKSLAFKIGSNFKLRILNFGYTSVYKRYFWEQFILPFYLSKDNIDLVHSLGYVGPILTPIKKIVSILDINYKGHTNNMTVSKKKMLGLMVNLSAKSAKKIITISEFSKNQIVKFTNTPAKKVLVTLLSGSNDNFVELNNISSSTYDFESPYIIAFSSPSPHKNIDRLILAFKEVSYLKTDLKLVLVGHRNKNELLMKLIDKNELLDKVFFTGFVPDDEIVPLISSAQVFVFPSLYEGFGIPLLDAQQCNVPVVSSGAGSLPEVGRNAAIYFDPTNVSEMAEKLLNVLNNSVLAEELKTKGLINRQNFSWKKTASQTLALYKEVLN
jgi:glycosyltransferase involved in cell wall biosynthesis